MEEGSTGGFRGRKAICMFVGAALVLSFEGAAFARPRTHDGLQVRGLTGAGYWLDSAQPAVEVFHSSSVHGAAASVELFVGGTPARGLILGGFWGSEFVPRPSIAYDDQTGSGTSEHLWHLHAIGPYLDYYPDPERGFHAMGTLAAAVMLGASGAIGENAGFATGFACGAGVGYDWWAGDEWSLGVLARLQYARLHQEGEESDASHDTIGTMLAFSFQYQ